MAPSPAGASRTLPFGLSSNIDKIMPDVPLLVFAFNPPMISIGVLTVPFA
jgi:hypothetical protein